MGTPFKYIIPYLEKRSTILLECPAVFLIGDQLFDFLITNYLGRCVIRIDIANHATSEMNILNYVDSVLSSEEKSGILNEKDIQFVFLIENVDLLPLQSRSLSDIGLNSFQNPLVVCTCNLGLEKRYRKEALEFFFGSHKILEFETIQSSIKEFFPDVAKICEAGQTEDPLFVPDMNSLSRFVNFYVEEGIKAVARTHPKLYSFVTAMIERQIVVVKDGKSDSEKDRVDGTVSSSSDSKIDNLRDDQSRLETSELTSKSKGKDYEKWKEEQGKEKEIQIKLVETVIEFCGTLAKDGLLQNQRDQEILISKFDQMSLEYFCLLCAPLQMNYVASSEADKPSYPAPAFVPQPDTQSTPAYIFPPLPCSVTFLYPSLFYFFVLLHVFDTTNIQTPREEKFVRYFRFLELPEIDEQLALYFVQAIKVQLIWNEIIDSFKSETLSDMYFATYPKLLHSYNFDYKKPLSNIKKLEDLLIQHSNVNSNNFNNTSNSNSNTTNNSNNNNNSPPVVSPRTVFQGQPKESIVRALQLHKLYSLWPRPIFATSYLVSNREHGKETAKLGILTYIWFGLCALFGYIVEDFNKESREIKGNKEKEKEIMKEISEIGFPAKPIDDLNSLVSSSIVFLSLEKLELYTVYLESNSKKPECIILCHPTPIAKAIQFHKLGVRFIVSLCCRLDLQTTDWNDKLFYVQSAFCITFMKALKADPNFELAFTIAIHSVPATYQGVFSLSIDNQSHFTYSPKQTKYLQTLQSFSLYNPISIPMKRNNQFELCIGIFNSEGDSTNRKKLYKVYYDSFAKEAKLISSGAYLRVISKNELTAELNQHNPLILHLSACACNDSNSKLDSTLFNVSNSQKKVQVPIPLVVLNICKSTELALDLLSKQFARIVLFSPIHVESSIGNKFFEGFYGKLANFKTSIDYDSCFHAYSSAISSLLSNSKLRQVPFLLYASTDLQDAFDRKQRQIQQSPTPLSNALVLKAALTRTNTNTISNYVSNTDNNNDSLAGLDFASVYALQFIKDSSSSDKSPCLLLLQTSSNSPLVNDIQSAAIRSWHPTLQVPVVLTFSPESRSISKQDLDFFNVVAGTSLKTLQNCEAIPLPPLIYLINLSQLTFISNSSHDILHDLLLKRFPRAPMIVFGLSEYESDLHDICVQANATELTVYRVLPIKSLNHSKFYTTAIDSSSISSILKEKILKFNELKDISNNDRSDGRKALRPEQFIPIPRLFIIIPSRNNSAALHFVCEEPHCHHIVPIYQHAGYTIGKLTSFVSKYFKHIAVGIQVLDKTDGCESRKAILNQLLSEFQKKETEKLLKSYESDKMSVLRELSKNNDLFQLESELTDFNRAQEWGVKHILLRGRYHWLCEEHALNYQEVTGFTKTFTNVAYAQNSFLFTSKSSGQEATEEAPYPEVTKNKKTSNNNYNSSNNQISLPQFSFDSLKIATNNFSESNKLGSGSFGDVYKGNHLHVSIAVKRLKLKESQNTQFHVEITSLSRFRHPNIIGILGYSDEDSAEKCLVYEFASNGSLRDRLDRKGNSPPLTWSQRESIALGIAIGMNYLQNAHPKTPFFHLDLKSANVLLDSQFQPKITDFGFAKPVIMQNSRRDSNMYTTATPVGDKDYICPEYLLEGKVSRKTDVYSYGCILVELLTGKKSNPDVIAIARVEATKKGNLRSKLDKTLDLTSEELTTTDIVSQICVQCIQTSRFERPTFGQIVQALLNKTMITEAAEEANNSECTLCSDAPIDCVLQPCNHAVMCKSCAQRWVAENRNCPVCHLSISQYDYNNSNIEAITANHNSNNNDSNNVLKKENNPTQNDDLQLQNQLHELTITNELLHQELIECKKLLNSTNNNSSNFMNISLPQFLFHSLKAATNNFSESNKLGSGAFGDVYKGSYLQTPIAVKKLKLTQSQFTQFQAELVSLSRFRHPNIIGLLGYSDEDSAEKCLVYEFASNGSLRDRLDRKDDSPSLTWSQRESIALGIAIGMNYLQYADPNAPFFHLNLKSANVLLDSQFQPKITDFGFAKPVIMQNSSNDSNMYITAIQVGDKNYICPEYLFYGKISRKTDVYSYGCILVELLTGKKSDRDVITLTRREIIRHRNLRSRLDKTLDLTDGELDHADVVSEVCVQCIASSRLDRPSFPKIIDALLNKSVVFSDVEEERDKECIACSNAPINCVLQPCNHAVMCQSCAERWISGNRNCLVCHGPVHSYKIGEVLNSSYLTH